MQCPLRLLQVSVVNQPGALPQIHPNAMGSRTTPTLVGFNSRGERLIGDRALSASCTSCVFYGARDLLGEPLGALSGFWGAQMTPYNVTKASHPSPPPYHHHDHDHQHHDHVHDHHNTTTTTITITITIIVP